MPPSDRRNDLNMGLKCIKYLIFFINFMFVITASLLIIIGFAIQAIYFDFNSFIDDDFFSPANLLIAVGFIMLLVSIFGCYGALKESVCLINMYGVMMILVFILEFSAAIAAFAMQGRSDEMLRSSMTDAIHRYKEEPIIKESVDFMQSQLSCCGVDTYKDWEGILEYRNKTYHEDLKLPESCCNSESYGDVCYPYTTGCLARLHDVISASTVLIAVGASTVALVQAVGIMCAFMLAKAIRRAKSIRLTRQYQLQQSLGVLTRPHQPAYASIDKVNNEENENEQEMRLPHHSSVY